MSASVLLLVVSLSSGGLLQEVVPQVVRFGEAPRFSGYLMPVQFQYGGGFGASALPPGFDTLSLEQLRYEAYRLSSNRPSPALGIGLTIGGAGLVVVSTVFLFVSILISVILFLPAVAMLVAGPIMWSAAIREGEAHDMKMMAVQRRIDQLQGQPAYNPPGGMPSAPTGGLPVYQPQLAVAF